MPTNLSSATTPEAQQKMLALLERQTQMEMQKAEHGHQLKMQSTDMKMRQMQLQAQMDEAERQGAREERMHESGLTTQLQQQDMINQSYQVQQQRAQAFQEAEKAKDRAAEEKAAKRELEAWKFHERAAWRAAQTGDAADIAAEEQSAMKLQELLSKVNTAKIKYKSLQDDSTNLINERFNSMLEGVAQRHKTKTDAGMGGVDVANVLASSVGNILDPRLISPRGPRDLAEAGSAIVRGQADPDDLKKGVVGRDWIPTDLQGLVAGGSVGNMGGKVLEMLGISSGPTVFTEAQDPQKVTANLLNGVAADLATRAGISEEKVREVFNILNDSIPGGTSGDADLDLLKQKLAKFSNDPEADALFGAIEGMATHLGVVGQTFKEEAAAEEGNFKAKNEEIPGNWGAYNKSLVGFFDRVGRFKSMLRASGLSGPGAPEGSFENFKQVLAAVHKDEKDPEKKKALLNGIKNADLRKAVEDLLPKLSEVDSAFAETDSAEKELRGLMNEGARLETSRKQKKLYRERGAMEAGFDELDKLYQP